MRTLTLRDGLLASAGALCTAWRTDPLRAPRPALIGGITLAIAITPALVAGALAADPAVVVRPGDTLTAISNRHGVSIRRLVELNDLASPNLIYAGERLRIGRASRGSNRAEEASTSRTIHVVKSGATLWGIAGHYGVSVSAIVAANEIADPGRIFAGQRLVIPGASARRPDPRPSSSGRSQPRQTAAVVHVVSRGSTLWGIAQRYGVSVAAIVAANRIGNPSLIFAGQRLSIPGAKAAGPSAAPRPDMPLSMAELVAERDWVRRVLAREAERQGVPRAFVLAVAWQESGWQQGVVSHAGAVGVMQLMPGTAEWIGQTMLGRPVLINDARNNIRAGVRLLRHYLDRYDGNRDLVLAAYYQGQRAVDSHGIYGVSRPYIASIKYLERLFGG
jgi:N-acetylmuramoyl-L-alanine amidase